jgi:hypothetical protein
MSRLRWFLHRVRGGYRCWLGLNRLRGFSDCGDGVNVAHRSPYGPPGRGDWRKCDWCGATWRGAYDGLSPFWQRTR